MGTRRERRHHSVKLHEQDFGMFLKHWDNSLQKRTVRKSKLDNEKGNRF
jgi:hypothetical protein